MMILLAQAAPAAGLDWQQFGAFGVTIAGCIVVIGALWKKLGASESREREMQSRVADLSLQMVPVLDRVIRALDKLDRT